MRPFVIACTVAALAAGTANAATRFRDLDPELNEKKDSPSNLEFQLSGSYVFELGPDAPGQTGWGMSLGAYVLPDKTDDEWLRSKWGASFNYFSTKGHENIGGRRIDSTIDAAYILFEYGLVAELDKNWEIGLIGGIGTGGFFGKSDDGSSTDSHGNWDWALQIKPTVTWKAGDHTHVYLAYKFAVMSPFYNTTLIGYRSVTMLHNSVELGVSFRF